MTIWADDVATAQALVKADQVKLAQDQAALTTLLANDPGKGVDVSENQGDIDWAKVKAAGVGWAFIRSSDGDYFDKNYSAARVQSVRVAGLIFGCYHYCRIASDANNQRDGRTEAAMAYYLAARYGWGKKGDFPLVYDAEKDPTDSDTFQGQPAVKAAAHVANFVRAYAGLTGHYPIFYTNPDTWSLLSPVMAPTDLVAMAKCPLYIADWGVPTPRALTGLQSWSFWQRDDHGTVNGITGPVDSDVFAGSKTDMIALTIK
jgi:lysozyme